MAICALAESEFNVEVMNSTAPALVMFSSPSCGPCRAVKPVLQTLSEKHPKVKFVEVDVGKCPALTRTYSIRSLPTLLLFHSKANKRVIDQLVGNPTLSTIEHFIGDS